MEAIQFKRRLTVYRPNWYVRLMEDGNNPIWWIIAMMSFFLENVYGTIQNGALQSAVIAVNFFDQSNRHSSNFMGSVPFYCSKISTEVGRTALVLCYIYASLLIVYALTRWRLTDSCCTMVHYFSIALFLKHTITSREKKFEQMTLRQNYSLALVPTKNPVHHIPIWKVWDVEIHLHFLHVFVSVCT